MTQQYENSGGVSSIFISGCLCVYGGPVPDKVWLLDLQDLTWDEVQCRGDIPAARHHHAVCCYKDRMLMHGGLLLDEAWEEHPFYSLDVNTGVWTHILTSGDAPGGRSHHTAVIVDDMMVVYGGRSTATENPTTLDLEEQKRQGFFDVYMLNLQQLQWYRIERYDPYAPMLWGHTAAVFRHFIVVYGGFDVSEPQPTGVFADVASAPVATLSEVVYIYDTQRCEWKRASPHIGQDRPVPRALHAAHILGAQMVIYGGMTVDANGRPTNVLDSWLWDISSGNWSPFAFGITYWSGKKPLGAVLPGNNTLVVANNQTETHFYTLNTAQWRSHACDPSRLYKPKLPPPAPPVYIPAPPPPPAPPAPPPQHEFIPEPERVPTPVPTNPPSMVSEQPAPTPAPSETPAAPEPTEPAQPFDVLPPPRVPEHPPPAYQQPGPRPLQVPHADPYAEERLRYHMQLVEQENQRRLEQVQTLRDRIAEMQDQLMAYQSMKYELAQPRHPLDNPELSPQRNTSFAIPATIEDAEAQDYAAHHLAQLAEQLTQMQNQSQRSLHEAYARHREQMEEAKKLHAERLKLIKGQQQEYQNAQLELANLETKQDTAELLRKQLSLLHDQQKQLSELQKEVAPVKVAPPAPTSSVPDQIRSMASALDKLSHASTLRGPSVTNAYPTGMHDVLGIQRAIKSMNTTFREPVHLDNRVPKPAGRLSPPRDTSRSPAAATPNHLQRIKDQIANINRTAREESLRGLSKRVSPPRLR
eukprot:TRINITY_DN9645_c0_g1_i1.p1 TRINITY_DN9645_c0_g1~~TRINITY_DN9645_c0_g1_i1.p1  ORF type:complete len:754 (+),score=149.07 TRINITY_DN9645_c0_g1_i1:653-2914(+)